MKRDKRNAAVVVSDPGDRAALLARVVPAALAVLLLMARGLLLHEHSSFRYGYPAAPLLAALHVRWPLDWLLAGAAVASLIIAAARPSRAARTAALACMALLFAGDQGRLFPGLYGFSLFLFALTAVRDPRVAADAVRVALAAVYMWSGVHKLSPHFAHDLRWFVAPVLRAIGVADGPSAWLTVAAWAAAAGETAFGVALLLPRGPSAVRAGALAAALAMHALIALCIGPLRGGWNNSAWAWNAATAVTAAVAFIARQLSAPHSTHAVARVVQWVVPPPAWRALWRSRAAAAVVALFLVAPALHLVDRWDTSLSFNVYTGNINSATIFMDRAVALALPAHLHAHLDDAKGGAMALNLQRWAMAASGASPYPEPRVWRVLLARVCALAGGHASLHLSIWHKASPLWGRWAEYVFCKDLA